MRRIALLMQEYGNSYKRLTHQNSNAYEILRHVIVPQDQDSINLDKNDFALSWVISNLEFAMEMKRLISKNELSLEYTKSILLWLIKLFDLKWQQLYDDLDYISKWRLLNLKKQAEFFLENFFIDNQQHEKSNDDKYISKDGNNNESTENVEEIILTKQNKSNLIETKTKININKFPMNTPSDTSKIETQIMNHQELTKHIEDNTKNLTIIPINQEFTLNTPTDVKDTSIINDTFFSKIKTFRDEDLIKNKTSSKLKEFIDIHHDEHMKDHEKQFNQLKNISSILPNENITSTLQEIDQRKHIGTDVTLQGSLKNITDIRKTPFRRTLQVLAPSNKNEKQKNRHVSTKNISDKHHYFNKRKEIKSDNGSAMDEILEAVDEVLPTDKSIEMSPKGSNTFSRIF